MKLHRLAPVFFFLFSLSLGILGCEKTQAPQPLPLSEAHQKFLKLCQEEYQLDIKLFPFENTLWIYLPLDKNFIEMKANPGGPKESDQPKEARRINYLNGKFEDQTFKITYDITPGKSYEKEYGYGNTYSEEYQNKQRNILTAIHRVYMQMESSDPKQPAPEKVPDFFILVAADIATGIETQMIINFGDLKRVLTDTGFQEEYVKRAIIDYPIGHPDIVGDREGKHLKPYDLSWGGFLSKQIIHRIRSKYERSAFPPVEEDKIEILKILKEAITAYQFEDYVAIELKDFNQKTLFKIDPEGLEKTVKIDPPEVQKGRLIEINFNPTDSKENPTR